MKRLAPWAVTLLTALVVYGQGCLHKKKDVSVESTEAHLVKENPPTRTAAIPANLSPFAPSQLELTGPPPDGNSLGDVDGCAPCHADAVAQWRTSAHAFGSFNNPIYRVVIDRFRAEVGNEASRFCAGCHDPALLVDGAMATTVAPEDPRSHVGISCRVCHNVASVKADGNGSYTLTNTPIPLPTRGDALSLRRHKERVAMDPLRTAQLCGSCHRSFLGPETGNPSQIVGMDDLTAWQRSAYAGSHAARVDDPIEQQTCQKCHMGAEAATRGDVAAKNGSIASHRFLGAHTWLAAMRHDTAQRDQLQARLHEVATIDVPIINVEEPSGPRPMRTEQAMVSPGASILFDVVVRNVAVGHRFPGGTLDAQDVWTEVTVHDATGAVVAAAGQDHETSGDDLSAHRLRAAQADETGAIRSLRDTQHFRTAVFNHTIPPRDAELIRYRWQVPRELAPQRQPLRITARLRHRSRNLALAHQTCAEQSTPRGQAFVAEVKRRTNAPFDACVAPPVTDIAVRTVVVGQPTEIPPPLSRAAWRRDYDHALGMLHAVQEQVDEARPSLQRALTDLPATATSERAMVMALLARVAVRQGRTDEALSWVEQSAPTLPHHAALAHVQGEAFFVTGRWREAVGPLQVAATQSPLDDELWSHLAAAYGSAGQPDEALASAQHALALQPRDQDALRVQALALGLVHAPSEEVDSAHHAYLEFRSPDNAPRVRGLCSKNVPGCALERLPVHVHELHDRDGQR